jgi:molybdopterin/thiamine biosynthesis adenylyltransferase
LNRIRSSLHEVGDKKIDRLAKKISEIDPYIEQVHFREGMTKANLDQLAEHKPNIIFDEVDDLEAKLALRLFARQHKIPLVMVTDLGDKSLVDIERYDQGHRMPFSGRLKEVELEALIAGELTKEEIKRLTVRIIGMRHITPRLLSSVMEIDNIISGIPQLGTTAAAGGALGSIVAREIILGRKLKSGRRVFSPKDTLHLQSPTSFEHGFKTVSKFIRTQKKTKK